MLPRTLLISAGITLVLVLMIDSKLIQKTSNSISDSPQTLKQFLHRIFKILDEIEEQNNEDLKKNENENSNGLIYRIYEEDIRK